MMMKTPFDILGVTEEASDAMVKKAYLRKVRAYPPERAPEQFQIIRDAFEAIQTRQQRLKYQLFHREEPSLDALFEHALHPGEPQRPSETVFIRALAECLKHAGRMENRNE
ncbi:MAG: J domain-containing protein [Gammaproteobacteria bacterium]|nr:J domain-containing protein [Gammaproteobacteria bacterium]